jgi:hypothetical protein
MVKGAKMVDSVASEECMLTRFGLSLIATAIGSRFLLVPEFAWIRFGHSRRRLARDQLCPAIDGPLLFADRKVDFFDRNSGETGLFSNFPIC